MSSPISCAPSSPCHWSGTWNCLPANESPSCRFSDWELSSTLPVLSVLRMSTRVWSLPTMRPGWAGRFCWVLPLRSTWDWYVFLILWHYCNHKKLIQHFRSVPPHQPWDHFWRPFSPVCYEPPASTLRTPADELRSSGPRDHPNSRTRLHRRPRPMWKPKTAASKCCEPSRWRPGPKPWTRRSMFPTRTMWHRATPGHHQLWTKLIWSQATWSTSTQHNPAIRRDHQHLWKIPRVHQQRKNLKKKGLFFYCALFYDDQFGFFRYYSHRHSFNLLYLIPPFFYSLYSGLTWTTWKWSLVHIMTTLF